MSTSIPHIIESPYVKRHINMDLWTSIQEAYAENPETYLSDTLPALEAWASKIVMPIIRYVDTLDEIETIQKLAPFAIIGFDLTTSNASQLLDPAAAAIKAIATRPSYQLGDIAEALTSSHLSLEYFKLSHEEFSREIMEALLGTPSTQTLKRIVISAYRKPAKGIDLIAKTHLPALTHLDLSMSFAGLRACKALFKSDKLPALTHLDLANCKLNASAIKALAESPNLSRLTHLGLASNKLGPEGLVPLAYSPHAASLRLLDVGNCNLEAPNIEALFDSPYMAKLRSLDISGSSDVKLVSKLLVQTPHISALERLDMHSYSSLDVGLLANAKNLENLKYLHASGSEQIIAASPLFNDCVAVKQWYFDDIDELDVEEDAAETAEAADAPEGWSEAFGELRALTQETGQHDIQELWEWISNTARKFPDLYTHRALPYLTTWAAKLPEPLTFDVTSSSLLGPMSELAPFARLHLVAEDVKTSDLKSRKAQRVYKISLSAPKSDRIAQGRAKAIGASKHLKNLKHLFAWANRLDDDGIAAIAQNPHLAELEVLELRASRATDIAARAIADSPHMGKLRTLDLTSSSLTADGIVAIANSPHLTRLEKLIPGSYRDNNEGALAIASSPSMSNLRSLALGQLGADGITALLESEHTQKLSTLHLHNITLASIEALASSPGALKLEHLTVEQGRNCPGAVLAIANSPNLKNLKSLSIPYAALSTEEIEAIANSPHLGNLHRLDMSDAVYTRESEQTCFGKEGLEALVAATHLESLVELDLATCGLGPESVEVITSSPFFERLNSLVLRDNGLSRKDYPVLATAPTLATLQKLVMTDSFYDTVPAWMHEDFEGAPFTLAVE